MYEILYTICMKYFFIAIVISIILTLLNAYKKPLITQDGTRIMHPKKGYARIGLATVIFFGVLYIFFMLDYLFDIQGTHQFQNTGDWLVPNIVFLALTGLGLWLILYEKKYKVSFDENKIIFQGITGSQKTMLWKDINKVTFNKIAMQFYLFDNNQKVYVHKHLAGFRDFVEMLKSQLNPKLTEQALFDLELLTSQGR